MTTLQATYDAAAARHTALVRQIVAASKQRQMAQQRLDRCIEANIDATAARRALASTVAEYERLDRDVRAANEAACAARAALTGEPAPKPAVSRTAPAVPATSVETRSETDLALDAGRAVSRDYHNQAVQVAVEAEQRKAASREYHLRNLLDMSAADRVSRILADLQAVPAGSAGLRHTPDCWQRHAACLANRLRSVLGGEAVA